MEFGYEIYLQKKVNLLIQFLQILFFYQKNVDFFKFSFFVKRKTNCIIDQ